MLGLLPELDLDPPRVSVYNILGPKLNCVQLPPGLGARLRAVELGHEDPPVLPVCVGNMRLVLLENSAQVLADWMLYRLGSFSACPVRYVTLNNSEARLNNQMVADAQRHSNRLLEELLDDEGRPQTPEDEEEPLTDDDLPFDDDEEERDPR